MIRFLIRMQACSCPYICAHRCSMMVTEANLRLLALRCLLHMQGRCWRWAS